MKKSTIYQLWILMVLCLYQGVQAIPSDVILDEEKSLEEVFKLVEKKWNVSFSYVEEDIPLKKQITFTNEFASLKAALKAIQRQTGLEFKVANHHVIVLQSNTRHTLKQAPNFIEVSGTVKDSETGEAVIGASIIVKGTIKGTVTDVNGNFSLQYNTDSSSIILEVRSVGYITQEFTATNGAKLDIVLQADIQTLEDIVVIGYGEVKTKDVTGSVGTVDMQSFDNTLPKSLEQGLQGQIAGVQVTSISGEPGAGARINIRGVATIESSAEPLYVIDGVPVSPINNNIVQSQISDPNFVSMGNTNPLATLSPSDIESIQVLKDASALAIYGSRASNGVIIITTKRGKAGKTKINFNYSKRIETVRNKLDVLNAREFAEYQNLASTNAGEDIPWDGSSEEQPTPAQIEAGHGEGNDWFDIIMQNGSTDDMQLQFSGGNDKSTYLVSGNFLNTKGTVKHSNFQRGGLRFNGSSKFLNEKLKMEASLQATRSLNNLTHATSNTLDGVVARMLYFPSIPSEAINGSNDFEDEEAFWWRSFGANPLTYVEDVAKKQTMTRGLGSLKLNYNLLDNLILTTRFGSDYYHQMEESYFPRTTGRARGKGGVAVVSNNYYNKLLTENYATYTAKFGGDTHYLSVMGGYTYEKEQGTWRFIETSGFLDDELEFYALQGARSTSPVKTGFWERSIQSLIGRLNYTLLDRYLFTFTIRRDGASNFAANKKWGTFPSVALAWRIDEEAFLQNVQQISTLKLRTSWGKSGNQSIAAYSSLSQVSIFNSNLADQNVLAADLVRLPNPDLTWENTTQWNVGLDVGLFENRLRVNADIYKKNTDGLLDNTPLAANTGYASKTLNAGSIENRGIEITISGDITIGKELVWTTSANFSRNRNEVTNLLTEERIAPALGSSFLSFSPFIYKEGLPVGSIRGYRLAGIIQNEEELANSGQDGAEVGQYKYMDLNDDGVISDEDQEIIGNVNPDFTLGWSNTLTYRNFDVFILFNGSVGGDVINVPAMRFEALNGGTNVPKKYVENAWSPENTDGKYQQVRRGNGIRFNDRFVEDATYIRLKMIRVGYNFKPKNINWFENARLYAGLENILTITRYEGFDPEVSSYTDVQRRGVDIGAYPPARSFFMGLNLTF